MLCNCAVLCRVVVVLGCAVLLFSSLLLVSEVKFLDLFKTNYCESICQRMFPLIKNEG